MLYYIFVTQTLEEMGLGLCVTVGVGRLKATRDFGYFLIKFSEIRKSEKCNLYHFTKRLSHCNSNWIQNAFHILTPQWDVG